MKLIFVVCALRMFVLVQAVTHQLNSDEDEDTLVIQGIRHPLEQPTQHQSSEKAEVTGQEGIKQERGVEPEIDATIPRNVRYSSGGYGDGGYSNHHGGYDSHHTGHGWSPPTYQHGHSAGGVVCTVCSNYEAQQCCAFGFRQCCNVRVYHNNHHSVGGAGYTHISPPSVYSSTHLEKPGSCRSHSNFGYSNHGYVNQNAGYYATRREDRVKRDAPLVGTHQTYGPPYHSTTGGYGYSSGHNGGYGVPSGGYGSPSGGYGSNHCRRDYDCPGNEKCCSGHCSNPVAVIG